MDNSKDDQNIDQKPIKDEVEQRFELLCSLGQTIEATSPSVDVDNKQPDYFDEQKFKRAQATCQKYYTNISMASTIGLILLLQIESILIPLLETGRSRTVVDLYDRYTATVRYIRKYYETNIYDKSSEGWRYIKLVRIMHQRVHKMMNEHNQDDRQPRGEKKFNRSQLLKAYKTTQIDGIWVNQYDMALTQFAFIGFFVLKPNKCAAYHITQEELSDVVYYWRLLSYYFGIEDRFNLFVYHYEDGKDEHHNKNNFLKQIKLLNMVLEHEKHLVSGGNNGHVHGGGRADADGANKQLENVSGRHPIGLAMGKGFMLAFEGLVKETTFNILNDWWHPYMPLSDKQDELTFSERIKRIRFLFTYKVLLRSETLARRINEKYKKKLEKWLAKGEENKRKLEKKYGHIRYELPQTAQLGGGNLCQS